jgi:hypothetical protein
VTWFVRHNCRCIWPRTSCGRVGVPSQRQLTDYSFVRIVAWRHRSAAEWLTSVFRVRSTGILSNKGSFRGQYIWPLTHCDLKGEPCMFLRNVGACLQPQLTPPRKPQISRLDTGLQLISAKVGLRSSEHLEGLTRFTECGSEMLEMRDLKRIELNETCTRQYRNSQNIRAYAKVQHVKWPLKDQHDKIKLFFFDVHSSHGKTSMPRTHRIQHKHCRSDKSIFLKYATVGYESTSLRFISSTETARSHERLVRHNLTTSTRSVASVVCLTTLSQLQRLQASNGIMIMNWAENDLDGSSHRVLRQNVLRDWGRSWKP